MEDSGLDQGEVHWLAYQARQTSKSSLYEAYMPLPSSVRDAGAAV